MAVREIKVMGDPVLRKTAKEIPVDDIASEAIQKLVDDLMETASQTPEDGFITAGIAAPQVGESLRIFLVLQGGSDPEYEAFINPDLDILSHEIAEGKESCLSTPNLCGTVQRYKEVKLTYFDREGKKQRKKLFGEHAIFVQHEFDHLEGILWVDKVTDTKTIQYC